MKAEIDIKAEIQRQQLQGESSATKQHPQMLPDEEKEALKYLSDPELMPRTEDDLTDMGIVGEDGNKVLGYTVANHEK